MFLYFLRIILFFALFLGAICSEAQYRSLPVGMSKKRFKQIQSRKYHKAERVVYKRKNGGSSFFSLFESGYTSARTINSNKINRKRNKRMVAKKRKTDANYQFYREYIEKSNSGGKNNFSIYDK